MFMRRALSTIVVLGLMLGLFATTGLVSAQETSQSEETLGGSVTWRDAAGLSDSVVIALTGVPQPEAGTKYYGWLVSSETGTLISVGELAVSGTGAVDVTYVDPDGANLLATYDLFIISNSEETSSPSQYFGSLHPSLLYQVRDLLVSSATNPGGKGVVAGLREQTQVALDLANTARASTTLADKQMGLQQVINVIEGSAGDNYDAAAGDGGDGFGVLSYASTAITSASSIKATALEVENEAVAAQADGVVASVNNAARDVTAALNNAVRGAAHTADDVILDLAITNVVLNLGKAINGIDNNGDGLPGNTAEEGGVNRAYVEAQDVGQIVLVKGDFSIPPPTPPSTGDVSFALTALGAMAAGLTMLIGGALLLRRRGAVAA